MGVAYDLFRVHGVRAVGVDRIIAESSVAKATLYHHFETKADLVVAVLDVRRIGWLRGMEAKLIASSPEPAGRLVAVFDLLDEWFREPTFTGAFYTAILFEFRDPSDPIHQAAREHVAAIISVLRDLAETAGIPEPEKFANQWMMLMSGATVARLRGDNDAAARAKDVAQILLASALDGLAEP